MITNWDQENEIILNDLEEIVTTMLPWNKLYRKRVLLTGGGGFLGAYLTKALMAANEKYKLKLNLILIIKEKPSHYIRLRGILTNHLVKCVHHDLGYPLPKTLPRSDYVIHCASKASPKSYGIDPVGTIIPNTIGTINLLKYATENQVQKFLYFSSGEVYGQPLNSNKEISEEDHGYIDTMQVRSCYAESKRISETMCAAWSKQFNLNTSVVRPFHTYGPGIDLGDGRVFADFVSDVVAQRNIVLKSDGLARRPFCYVADATAGFLTVLLKGESSHAYNIANPREELSIIELGVTLANLFPERGIEVKYENVKENGGYLKSPISRQKPCIKKISKLGWEPKTDIKTGFRKTINYYLTNTK